MILGTFALNEQFFYIKKVHDHAIHITGVEPIS